MSKVTKGFSKGLLGSFLVVSLVLSAGCGAVEPTKEPNEIIKDGVEGIQNATSHSYDVNLKLDLEGAEGAVPQKIKFDGNLKGLINAEDEEKPSFSIDFDGKFALDAEEEQRIAAGIRYIDQVLYARLDELPLGEGNDALTEDLKKEFFSIWWNYPVPDELIEQYGLGASSTELSDEQKEIKDLFEKSDFIEAEYLGNADMAGANSFKYKVTLDEDGFVDFVIAVNKQQKQIMSDTEKEELKKAFEAINFEGVVYVTTGSDPYISGIEGTVTIDAKAEKDGSGRVKGTIEFAWKNADVNKGLKVEVPKETKVFNQLFLAYLGLLGSQPLAEPSTLRVDDEVVEDVATE